MGYKRIKIHTPEQEKIRRSGSQKFYKEPANEFENMHHHDAMNMIFRKAADDRADREISNNNPSLFIRPKLTVGNPNDKYELEADRVAESVVNMSDSDVQRKVYGETLQAKSVPGKRLFGKYYHATVSSSGDVLSMPVRNTAGESIQAKGFSDEGMAVSSSVESGIRSIRGRGEPLGETTRNYFEPRFYKADFSKVRVHSGNHADQLARDVNARAFTIGNDIVFRKGEYNPRTREGKRLMAHELTHVLQQSINIHRQRITPLRKPVIQRVAPVVIGAAIWIGKALAATSIDILIDCAIGLILGIPAPGRWAQFGNFLLNLIPGLGEAKKIKKFAKLFKIIDKILDTVRRLKKFSVPGSSKLLKTMSKQADKFKDAISKGDLGKAKNALQNLIGYLREAQVAARLEKAGEKIVHLGKDMKLKSGLFTEIDTITEKAGKLIYTQVKAGKGAILTSKSNNWDKFINQVNRTVELAADNGAKVRYVVDGISKEALDYLKSKGIDVQITHKFLK